ncbi:hypothetical protein HMPREF0080_01137 [Anaeroglobus geminatus F0357]|uniref:Uncharacterized protein n=1 Tax=Anaeroglobus geminatus F0357 TaxID=861450 RepID=G9YHK3_9FIRM|nr:hypothetical protein HMPREF0080_01137 [Anaeroglobus geminatus F0357]
MIGNTDYTGTGESTALSRVFDKERITTVFFKCAGPRGSQSGCEAGLNLMYGEKTGYAIMEAVTGVRIFLCQKEKII